MCLYTVGNTIKKLFKFESVSIGIIFYLFSFFIFDCFVLFFYQKFTFLEILFTCISAFATVGFDIGLTGKLNHFGQFILIIGMFVVRLGILLLLSAVWQALYKSRIERQKRIGYPKADLYV